MCVWSYTWSFESPPPPQECKSPEIDAVPIKKSMTEYHHWVKVCCSSICNIFIFLNIPWGKEYPDNVVHSEVQLVKHFHSFEALNDAFEVQYFIWESADEVYTLSRDTETI